MIVGDLPLFQYQVDICSDIPFFGSCPIGLTLSEHYDQPLSVQILTLPNELQANEAEMTQVSVAPGSPNLALEFDFTAGNSAYDYSFPLPAMSSPGSFNVTIPLTQILGHLVDLGLPDPLLNIVSLNILVSLASSVHADLSSQGFVSDQQQLIWDTPSTDSFNGTLTGALNDSYLGINDFRSVFSIGADLELKLPLLSPINLFSFQKDLLDFGASGPLPIGHWFQVSVSSAHSQASGSGWYLSGTSATLSIADSLITDSAINYQFAGWAGTGLGSYTGVQPSITITVAGPIEETANWQVVQQSPILPTAAIAGLGIVAVVAVAATLGLYLLKRPKK